MYAELLIMLSCFKDLNVILLAAKHGNWRRAGLCCSLGNHPHEEWNMVEHRFPESLCEYIDVFVYILCFFTVAHSGCMLMSWDYSVDYVVVSSLYSLNIYHVIVLFVFRTKHVWTFNRNKKLKVQFQVNKEAIFSRLHTKTLWNASRRSLVGMDTWPKRRLVLKGFRPSLKSS